MTTILSINASAPGVNRALTSASKETGVAMERLASGKKINSAADDAAGFSIAETMTSQIKGLNRAVKNINDAISLVTTAQATTKEISDIVQRIRELTVQSLNELNTQSDKEFLQLEIESLVAEIDKIATQSNFNGTSYHQNTMYSIQTGINDGDQFHFHTPYVSSSFMGNALAAVQNASTISNASTDSDGNPVSGISSITVDSANWDGNSNKFAVNDFIMFSNFDAPHSETGNQFYQVLTVLDNEDGSQTLTISGEIEDQASVFAGNNTLAYVVAEMELPEDGGFKIISNGGSKTLANLDVTDSDRTSGALASIDFALRTLNDSAVRLGVTENRLHFSISNLVGTGLATEAARSRIQDTDFAVESARLAKSMVLQQSAAAMLSQSNAQPELVLSLIKG